MIIAHLLPIEIYMVVYLFVCIRNPKGVYHAKHKDRRQ